MSNRMPDVRTNLDLRSPDRLRTGPHRMDPTAVLRMMLRCQRTLRRLVPGRIDPESGRR
jgi:hypothetical protein